MALIRKKGGGLIRTMDDGDGGVVDPPTPDPSGGDYSTLPGYGTDPNEGFNPEGGQNPTDYPPELSSGWGDSGGNSGGGMGLGDLLKSGGLLKGLTGAGSALMSHEDMVAMLAQQLRLEQQRQALQESQLDPYRQNMMQMGDMGKLDRAANMDYSTQQASPDRPLQAQTRWKPSAAMIAAAIRTRNQIASGKGGVGTMTDPSNWGKTSDLDFSDVFTDNPAAGSAAGIDPNNPDDPRRPGNRRGGSTDHWGRGNAGGPRSSPSLPY